MASTSPQAGIPDKTVLYVLVPPSPLFAAHWSLFLPGILPFDEKLRRCPESSLGRRIHVSGDRLNGFKLEIVRDYNVSLDYSVQGRRFPVAFVLHQFLVREIALSDGPRETFEQKDDEGGGYIDNRPMDAFERACMGIEAPGPSLNPVSCDDRGFKGKNKPREVKDCQWWVKAVIVTLAEAGMVTLPDDTNIGSEDRSLVPLALVPRN